MYVLGIRAKATQCMRSQISPHILRVDALRRGAALVCNYITYENVLNVQWTLCARKMHIMYASRYAVIWISQGNCAQNYCTQWQMVHNWVGALLAPKFIQNALHSSAPSLRAARGPSRYDYHKNSILRPDMKSSILPYAFVFANNFRA